MTHNSMNSPFRYAGGKFYARKLIMEYIDTDHDLYVEPFVGGGSIFFFKPKANQNWLNDIDLELTNCYRIIRDRPNDLSRALSDEILSKERHAYYKNQFKPSNELDRAIRWYYLNRTSYSGIMNMKNCYWSYEKKYSMRLENWGKTIERASDKLQGVEITSLDFNDVMQRLFKMSDKRIFAFIDPPYLNADQHKFYTHSFSKREHFDLERCLRDIPPHLTFLLTYDNCEEIRNLYSWANIVNKEWNYTINRTDDQKNIKLAGTATEKSKGTRYKGKEVFITPRKC